MLRIRRLCSWASLLRSPGSWRYLSVDRPLLRKALTARRLSGAVPDGGVLLPVSVIGPSRAMSALGNVISVVALPA